MIVITLPAYNEEKTIAKVLSDIKSVMSKTNYEYKILVVDDGSDDQTAKVAKESGAIVYSHPKNYGLAETFRTEIEKALELDAEITVHIDSDGQYVPNEIPKLIHSIDEGNDLVLGNRFSKELRHMSFIKSIGNKAFSRVISQVTGIKINDAQTGLRAFTKKVAEKIEISSLHTYTQEQIIRAVKSKFRIKEIPITFLAREVGKSKLVKNPFEYALRAWVNIFRIYRDYEPLKFFCVFGFGFLFLGGLLGLLIIYSYIKTGTVGGLPRVMLTVLLISMGVQIILFGFLADILRR
ncbi:MAG: glycosyltransferase family 2 protein [Nanoarchaeota archaeon]